MALGASFSEEQENKRNASKSRSVVRLIVIACFEMLCVKHFVIYKMLNGFHQTTEKYVVNRVVFPFERKCF